MGKKMKKFIDYAGKLEKESFTKITVFLFYIFNYVFYRNLNNKNKKWKMRILNYRI